MFSYYTKGVNRSKIRHTFCIGFHTTIIKKSIYICSSDFIFYMRVFRNLIIDNYDSFL